MSRYRIERLHKQDRSTFTSTSPALDRYLRERAAQDMKRRVATCFLAMDDADQIAGYYTIAATSLVLDLLPPDHAKRLPRYPAVPAVLLGRLAVASAHQRKGLGGALLADAIIRASQAEVMVYGMVVDAKDETAARFYEHMGFERLSDTPHRLIRAL